MRVYAEGLRLSYWNETDPNAPPTDDFLAGFDLWREYGYVDSELPRADRCPFWGELYLGGAYHTTNFAFRGYDAARYGADLKAGFVLGRTSPTLNQALGGSTGQLTPLMPYCVLDFNLSSSYPDRFWENLFYGGGGVRTEYRLAEHRKIEFFAEFLGALRYFGSGPLFDDIPQNDFRIGLTFQYDRY